VKVKVDTLIRPSRELTKALDTGKYQAFFYAGHGIAAPNGGSLFLRLGEQLNGTELAQALVRNQVILTVFNACWGAYPAKSGQEMIPRSSLAEVLIHHGVPAVLAMSRCDRKSRGLEFYRSFYPQPPRVQRQRSADVQVVSQSKSPYRSGRSHRQAAVINPLQVQSARLDFADSLYAPRI
jgi:hypothetical protein